MAQRCDLTLMNVLCTELVNEMTFDQKNSGWVTCKVVRLQSEIRKFKSVDEKTFAAHCSFGLFTLKYHLLEHLLDDLERFGRLSFVDAGRFEQFLVLIEKFQRMTS